MEVQITLIDSSPAFPCTYEVELAQVGGPSTTLGIGTADPFPVEVVPDSLRW